MHLPASLSIVVSYDNCVRKDLDSFGMDHKVYPVLV